MQLERLVLLAVDPEALLPFYADVLGLPVAVGENTLTVFVGASQLVFERAPSGTSPNYHVAFNIPPRRFAEALEWLRARTPLVAAPDGRVAFRFESWNADAVYFLDPAANSLELIARHDLTFDTPGPFGPSHLANVSEIGLVFDDVPEAVAAIERQTGLTPYRDVSDTFAPVGDEHGLFIVVRRGRVWFNSADSRAEPFPAQADIAVDGRRYAVDVSGGHFVARLAEPPQQSPS